VPKTDFSLIESLENWVTWSFLRGELKWSTSEVAYEMWVNEQRLVEWVNARRIPMENTAKGQIKKVEQMKKDLRAKYVKEDETKKRELDLDVKKVVKLYIDDPSLPSIAKKLKVDYGDFLKWWNKNLQNINALWRRENRG
jgi:hypothetical protein